MKNAKVSSVSAHMIQVKWTERMADAWHKHVGELIECLVSVGNIVFGE